MAGMPGDWCAGASQGKHTAITFQDHSVVAVSQQAIKCIYVHKNVYQCVGQVHVYVCTCMYSVCLLLH